MWAVRHWPLIFLAVDVTDLDKVPLWFTLPVFTATIVAAGVADAPLGEPAARAILGAWIGFKVPRGLLAVPTTIVSAPITANFALIALGITEDRHDQAAG